MRRAASGIGRWWRRLAGALVLGGVLGSVSAAEAGVAEIQAFVGQFYREVLAREPGAAEVSAWTGFLAATPTPEAAAVMSRAFFRGAEYANRPVTPWMHVTLLYRAILGRDPSPDELGAWASHLIERSAAIFPPFLGSPEFMANAGNIRDTVAVLAAVEHVYRQVLGRRPGGDEKSAWATFLLQTRDPTSFLAALFGSVEYQGVPRTLAQHVAVLYRGLLAREPAPEEVAAWVAFLADQVVGIEDVFVGSPEFRARLQRLAQ